ncbi:MAG TPA: hypothetical protein VMV29_13335 [Ktedonobacterales bacterium]|nr:hypothetical protein [Ktedonobacterales bacterium]
METPQGTPHHTTTATATSVHRSAWQPSWEKGGRKGKPRARSNIWVWVVSGLILSVIFVPLGLLALHVADNVPVFDTAKQFCVAEEQGNYSAAYNLLSHRAQQTVNETQFGEASQQASIADCSPLQNGASFNALGSSVTLKMSYSVPVNSSSSATPAPSVEAAPNHFVTDDQGTMRLVHDSDGWRVDAVTTSLFTLF